jgi:hypothetical protein
MPTCIARGPAVSGRCHEHDYDAVRQGVCGCHPRTAGRSPGRVEREEELAGHHLRPVGLAAGR